MPPPDYLGATLVNEIANILETSSKRGLILVLDDYHAIRGEALYGFLAAG